MRTVNGLMFASVLLLAACGKQGPAAPGAPAANSNQLSGTALVDQPSTLAPGATLNLRLLDTTSAESDSAPVAEQSIPITGLPATFTMDFDRKKIDPVHTYSIDGSVMVDNQVGYVATSRVRVLTNGNPAARINIMLVKALSHVATDPAGKFKNDFADFEAHIGGLKRLTGERIIGPEGKEVAIGWDAFTDKSGVRLVREQVANPDQSNETYRYAFTEDGKPWVIVHQRGDSTLMLGWDGEGKIVLKERDGKPVTDVKDAQAEELVRRAREVRAIASAQAG